MKTFFALLFLALPITISLAGEGPGNLSRNEGVILDENGLTIKLGGEPVVDEKRWNFNQDTFTSISKDDSNVSVKVYRNSMGKVSAVEKNGFGEDSGFYANDVINLNNNLVITSSFCNQLEKKNVLGEINRCEDLEKNLSQMYLQQFDNDEIFSNISKDINASVSQKVFLKERLQGFADEFAKFASAKKSDKKFNDSITSKNVLGVMINKCSELKRYSKVPEVRQEVNEKSVNNVAK